MYLRILKRDLKRKKTMNLILLVFVMMAATFLASSVNNLISVSTAVDDYLDAAHPGDVLIMTINDTNTQIVGDYLREETTYNELGQADMIVINDHNTTITSGTTQEVTAFQQSNTTAITEVPEEFMKVYENDGSILSLERGEIVFTEKDAKENEVHIGDMVTVDFGSIKKDFKLTQIVKDAVFGSDMMGFSRVFISSEEYDELWEYGNQEKVCFFSIYVDDSKEFLKQFQKQSFATGTVLQESTLHMMYVMDMLVSAMLIIVSICLILIAFLILRFTILFTLQEDFKEIGVMKALGLKNRSIKLLYLVKYFAISVIGATVGLIISFPFGDFLLDQAITNVQIESNTQSFPLHILCAAAVVIIVVLYCYLITGKLRKFSAMEAIRDGENGESFQKIGKISMHRRKKMPVFLYLAWNDVISHIRRYIVLILTFCLGALLILLPMSAMNTLSDDSIVTLFDIAPSTMYVNNGELEKYIQEQDRDNMMQELNAFHSELTGAGIENRCRLEIGFFLNLYGADSEEMESTFVWQSVHYEENEYTMLKGYSPKLANEIAITEVTAEDLNVTIGDTVHTTIDGIEQEFLICGLYQSMNNMGKGARISPDFEISMTNIGGIMSIQVDVYGDMKDDEARKIVKELHPEYEVESGTEYVSDMVGGILDQIDKIKLIFTVLVVAIDVLITVVMMKAFITRERGEIALLKSIGFSNMTIRLWHTARIIIVLVTALILGTLLSLVLDDLTIAPIFGMMGAKQIHLILKPFDMLVKYPLILIVCTGLAAFLCTRDVKKIAETEVNNME